MTDDAKKLSESAMQMIFRLRQSLAKPIPAIGYPGYVFVPSREPTDSPEKTYEEACRKAGVPPAPPETEK